MPTYPCILCDRSFQFGTAPGIYRGRHIGSWGVEICDGCLRGNWDGIDLETRPRLAEHLRGRGISVTKNAKGLVNIPSS